MAGYSGTPLARKLGIKPGARLYVVGAPGNYRILVTPLPERVTLVTRIDESTDIVHTFVTKRARLKEALRNCVAKTKRSSKVDTDITEDTIRELALPMGGRG